VASFGFDRFETFLGPGTESVDPSKRCNIVFDISYPSCKFYATGINSRGFACIGEGAAATFTSTYSFLDDDTSQPTTTRTTIQGGGLWAAGQIFTKSDLIPSRSIVWSPCGVSSSSLSIWSQVESALNHTAVVDSVNFEFKWDVC
jgi:hypothetical protein